MGNMASPAEVSGSQNAAWVELAAFDDANGDEVATVNSADVFACDRCIAPAQKNGVAEAQPHGLIGIDLDMGEPVHGFGGRQQQGVERSHVSTGFIESRLQGVQRHRVAFLKGFDESAAQVGDMAVAAEAFAHIAGQRAHIGALAANDFEDSVVDVRRCFRC